MRAHLDHASRLARSLDHPLAFVDVVAGGLLHVNVFACLARPDGGQRVPVIRRGDRDGVDVLIGEYGAHIGIALGLLAGLFFDVRGGSLERRLVDVAQRSDAALRQLDVFVHVGCAAASQPDYRHVDLVVRSQRARNGERRSGREKGSSRRK